MRAFFRIFKRLFLIRSAAPENIPGNGGKINADTVPSELQRRAEGPVEKVAGEVEAVAPLYNKAAGAVPFYPVARGGY